MSNLPILVIGGGVAGSSCALRLRDLGIDVHLAEKDVFPRAKVCGCCLGGAGLETLDEISAGNWVRATGVETTRWQASMAGRLLQLPLPAGVLTRL